jgi:lipopolysaccharide transport system ATP-binding protein
MSTAIKVENLSKIYRLGEIGTGTISRDMERWFKTKVLKQDDPFLKIGETNDRTHKGDSNIVYSLRDINFEINQGDAVGVIGRNGAGKSTLLKILSRVTTPNTGKINIKGRVASLLEVGTGFHPELTGRENIYLNGAILGMRKREIDRKLDEIIDFSGVERYIDTPVKRYSSGMYVRLAFAVAAHLESEILIVDEVLAVGDAEFQKKCLGKMGQVSKGDGKTVLFVSHNLASVSTLCDNGIYLNNGQVSYVGSIENVIAEYQKEKTSKQIGTTLFPFEVNNDLYIEGYSFSKIDGLYFVLIEFELRGLIDNFRIGFKVYNLDGKDLIRSLLTDYIPGAVNLMPGKYKISTSIDLSFLAEGEYKFAIHCSVYGKIDFLLEDLFTEDFEIFRPANFNLAYPMEITRADIITTNLWKINVT